MSRRREKSNMGISIRHIAAIAITGESHFPPGSTTDELMHASKGFDAWWEGFMEKTLTVDQQSSAYDAIWSLTNAHCQYEYEAGFRAGAMVMQDVYATPPSRLALQQRARASCEKKYSEI